MKSDLFYQYKKFIDNELSGVDLQQVYASSTSVVVACTFITGALDAFAKHHQLTEQQILSGLEQTLGQRLGMDVSSSQHWLGTCERLCGKYPLLKAVYDRGMVAMATWLERQGRIHVCLPELLATHSDLTLLELELDGVTFTRVMTDEQRAQFNSQFVQARQRSSRGRRIFIWVLVLIAVAELAFLGRYYGFW